MYCLMVLWDLTRSRASLPDLNHYAASVAAEYAELEGLLIKTWISDSRRNTWGAVYLWRSSDDAWRQPLPSRAVELIGYPPTSAAQFDVVAQAVNPEGWAELLAGGGVLVPPSSPQPSDNRQPGE